MGDACSPLRSAAVTTTAYTDGACSGNPGPGGWAWAVPGGAFASGFEPRSTNQRMEIRAAFEAVQAIEGPLEIVSDSTYVVHCFRDGWWEGWLKRGWLNSQRKPVANRDLWEPFIELVRRRDDVTFRWVKGHSGDPMNDLVDALAVEAVTEKRGRSGDEPPEVLGPPDRAGRPPPDGGVEGRDPRLPAGTLCGVFGHRPTELGGHQPNPTEHAVKARLVEILRAKREVDDDLIVVSGLRLGAELLGAEAAQEVGLRLVAVLPYPNPESVWPTPSQERFRRAASSADSVLTLEHKVPKSKQQAGSALSRRDGWLAANLDQAVVVFDGKDRLIGRLVEKLEDRVGADVWIVDPAEA